MTIQELVHLRRARDLIDREYARPLDVPAMARAALMSPAHFSRRFRAAYGETPYSYLMTRRIERAKALLRLGELSVTDVCMAVGCTSLGSFSTRFTELVGESPSAYRARDHTAIAVVPGCYAMFVTRPMRRPPAPVASPAPALSPAPAFSPAPSCAVSASSAVSPLSGVSPSCAGEGGASRNGEAQVAAPA